MFIVPGYVQNSNGILVKTGQHYESLDVLHNGDSLFEYYFIDSAGWKINRLYYTSNMGKTKDIDWNTGGKNSKLESILQNDKRYRNSYRGFGWQDKKWS